MVRTFAKADFEQARARMGEHVYHTPLITSRLLGEKTGFDVRLKAELFQRGGSYKIRGPMNKFALLTDGRNAAASSARPPATTRKGVRSPPPATASRAVVVMAENATPSKVAATRVGADVVLHGRSGTKPTTRPRQLASPSAATPTFIRSTTRELIQGQGPSAWRSTARN
jgi:threonine dehydratase